MNYSNTQIHIYILVFIVTTYFTTNHGTSKQPYKLSYLKIKSKILLYIYVDLYIIFVFIEIQGNISFSHLVYVEKNIFDTSDVNWHLLVDA